MNIIVFLLIIILLVVLNAFFIAAETSLLSSRKTSIDDQASKGNRSAKMVSLAFKKIHPYLSTPIIGSTIISIALGSIVEPILAKKIESYLHFIPNQFQIISAHSISFVIALLLLTSFHVIFGEYIPKTIAIQAPEKFILLLIGPLTFFVNFFKPFINILNSITSYILKLFGTKNIHINQSSHSREEILRILNESKKTRKISAEEIAMVSNILSLKGVSIGKIMIKKDKIIGVNFDHKVKEANDLIINQKKLYSRYPVYKEVISNIVGHIHIADLHRLTCNGSAEKKIGESKIIKRVVKISSSKDAKSVLLKLKAEKAYAGIIVNNKNETEGLVTLADIVSSILK